MKGKKLFTLLSVLDEEEFGQLGRAVNSPLMNTNPRIIALYAYLQSYYPDFDGPGLESGILFSRTFPDEEYNDYKLRRLLSGLSRLTEKFLVYREALHEEREAPLLLIRALGRRNLHSLFQQRSEEILRSLESASYRDLDYYRQKVEVFSNYYFHPFTDKRSIDPAQLQELVYDMDYRYALEMYRLGNELRNRERIFSEEYRLAGIDAMGSQYADGKLSENAIFRTYRSLIRAYQDEENPELFRELKQNFVSHVNEMRQDDLNLLFQQLMNYTIRRINQGDNSYYREALSLYKMGLQAGWLIDGGRISEATFSNIVLASCEEGEFGWARTFIGKYENFLDESARKDTLAHCYGLWYYFQGRHDEALRILASHRFSTPFQPSSRMTAIRIIFEQFFKDESYFGLLLSQVKAFEKFLSRDSELAEGRKELHKNTLSLIRRIAIAVNRREPPEEIKEWALSEITSGQAFILRNWLRERMQQLTALSRK